MHYHVHNFLFNFYIFLMILNVSIGILYPYDSETRDSKSLNGLWTFKISPDKDIGFNNYWYMLSLEEKCLQWKENDNAKTRSHFAVTYKERRLWRRVNAFTSSASFEGKTGDCLKMPVPASFNDITTNSTIRDFLGWAWYQRSFFVPRHWQPTEDKRVFIHFGAVHYTSKVWVNGKPVGEHVGGYLPFQVELTDVIKPGTKNNVTVAVYNALNQLTLPQATFKEDNTEADTLKYNIFHMNCDYYNYAGINRPVTMFTTPKVFICDVDIETDFRDTTGIVDYKINVCGGESDKCNVKLFDAKDFLVAESEKCEGKMEINNVSLWWPIMSNHTSIGYMYNFQASIFSNESEDTYRLPIGIRKVEWTSSKLLINKQPVYLHGLGMHEDSNIRGRGFDYSVLTRDLNLMQWLGANSFRTSHYPYAEETIHEANSLGILVIMEAPACSLESFSEDMYNVHVDVVREMLMHFKNNPSIIMWSLANEPNKIPTLYFRDLIDFTKSVDKTRPVTIVIGQHAKDSKDTGIEHVDIICVNRYYGWYTSAGRLDLIQSQIVDEFRLWKKNFNKPVMMSEYGAGSLSGYTAVPSTLWTEDYHVDFMVEHFKAFDLLRSEDLLIGEMVWNFIDFNVQQEYFRPGKCSKGLFTRERQPKAASYIVRARYQELAIGVKNTDTQCQSLHLGMRNIRAEPFIQSAGDTKSGCKSFTIETAIMISCLLYLNFAYW